MKREKIKHLALLYGFKVRPQGEGTGGDLNPYVYEFAERLLDEGKTEDSKTCYECANMRLCWVRRAMQDQILFRAPLDPDTACGKGGLLSALARACNEFSQQG